MALVLIRGLPGSGKSTIAKSLYGFVHLEADMYFVDAVGNYQYEKARIKDAHEWCQRETKKYLEAGKDVVVSNTFTRRCEIEPYIKIADAIGITPNVLIAAGKFENVHGVPADVIENMRNRWEEF